MDATHLEGADSRAEMDENEHQLAWKKVKEADGIIVPGGFGLRQVCPTLFRGYRICWKICY